MDGWIELARAFTGTGDLLVLRERAGSVELRCNGWALMSSRAHYSEAVLAVLACEQIAPAGANSSPPPLEGLGREADQGWGEGEHLATAPPHLRIDDRAALNDGAPHVLIGGLGFGYTLRAALDHLPQSARVTVAELLPELIAWNRGPLAPFADHPLTDPRVSVTCADVAALLRAAEPASFDAILLDTDNGPDAVMLAGNASLYEPETLRLVRHAFRPGGVLAVWSADPSPRFERNLRGAGFQWRAHDVPARGAPDDPLHTIYLAWQAA